MFIINQLSFNNLVKFLLKRDWLLFWGSFLGGVATLIAVFLTLSQNSEIMKQNDELIKFNHKNLQLQEEMLRLNLMPLLDIRMIKDDELHLKDLYPPNGYIILKSNKGNEMTSRLPRTYQEIISNNFLREVKNKHNNLKALLTKTGDKFIRFELTQKTKNTAKNICVTIKNIQNNSSKIFISPLFALAEKESVKIPIFITNDFLGEKLYIIFNYEDIEGRSYLQHPSCNLSKLLGCQFHKYLDFYYLLQ